MCRGQKIDTVSANRVQQCSRDERIVECSDFGQTEETEKDRMPRRLVFCTQSGNHLGTNVNKKAAPHDMLRDLRQARAQSVFASRNTELGRR